MDNTFYVEKTKALISCAVPLFSIFSHKIMQNTGFLMSHGLYCVYSLDSRHFDPDSRPVSGTRLSPLDHVSSHALIGHFSIYSKGYNVGWFLWSIF